MQRFICVFFAVFALSHALPYGSSYGGHDSYGGHGSYGGHDSNGGHGSYGGHDSNGGHGGYGAPAPAPAPSYSSGDVIVSQEPPVLYNIPPPSVWNVSPARPAGPVLTPVDAHYISGTGTPSSLIGISSQPSAIAAAASANVPLNAGSYKLLVVPSYEVPNIVGPSAGGYGGHRNGGHSYGGHSNGGHNYAGHGRQAASY